MELSILRNYQQTPKKIIKTQDENKNRNNLFNFHQFIDFIADLIRPLSIFDILLSSIYIYISIYMYYTYIYIYIIHVYKYICTYVPKEIERYTDRA